MDEMVDMFMLPSCKLAEERHVVVIVVPLSGISYLACLHMYLTL